MTRNEAIDELEAAAKLSSSQMAMRMRMGEIIDQLSPRWIPVAERLPERSGRHLVAMDDYVQEAYWSSGRPHDTKVGWFADGVHLLQVDAWCDLPAAPGKEDAK